VQNLYRFLLATYASILGLFLLWPRSIDEFTPTTATIEPTTSAASQAAHNLLYISGYQEILGNFAMLIPVVLLIRKISPAMKSQSTLLICLFATIFIELLQIYIPGRVSDVRDVVLNAGGASTAMVFLEIRTRRLMRCE
jgi:VanZ family protein